MTLYKNATFDIVIICGSREVFLRISFGRQRGPVWDANTLASYVNIKRRGCGRMTVADRVLKAVMAPSASDRNILFRGVAITPIRIQGERTIDATHQMSDVFCGTVDGADAENVVDIGVGSVRKYSLCRSHRERLALLHHTDVGRSDWQVIRPVDRDRDVMRNGTSVIVINLYRGNNLDGLPYPEEIEVIVRDAVSPIDLSRIGVAGFGS